MYNAVKTNRRIFGVQFHLWAKEGTKINGEDDDANIDEARPQELTLEAIYNKYTLAIEIQPLFYQPLERD